MEHLRRDAKKPKAEAAGPDIVWQDRQGGVFVAEVKGARGSALRDFSDQVRQREDASAVVLASTDDGKVALVVNLDNALAEIDAVKIVRELGPIIGGGGGGRPTLAEAGGKNVDAVRMRSRRVATGWSPLSGESPRARLRLRADGCRRVRPDRHAGTAREHRRERDH